MDEAREAISGSAATSPPTPRGLTRWPTSRHEKQRELFITEFVPMEPGITDRAAKNVEAARATVRGILEGRTSEGIGESAFGLVQAGVESCDHYRRARDPESLFRRSIMRPNWRSQG